jgi:glucose/arabinose dehydrogenase
VKPFIATFAFVLSLLVTNAADGAPKLKLLGERFVSPIALAPLDKDRLLVADQIGRLFIAHKEGATTNKLVFEFTPQQIKFKAGAFDERGLVGIALHPKFSANHKLYAYYSAPLRDEADTNYDHTIHLSEFTFKNDRVENERVVLKLDLPANNHHGGRMAFGPDGFLYIGVGDGGKGNDVGYGHSPQGNGQDTQKLLGKILRIDVDNKEQGKEYAIPKDNPFVGTDKGRPEIFAWGFRNPWGLCFDRGGDHQLFVAEVGQDSWEEVDIVTKGGNYGWNIREGFVCFNPKSARNPPEDCPKVGAMGEPLIDPIFVYKNLGKYAKDPDAKGCSITGGYVYRGQLFPQLVGKYIFADWSSTGWAKPGGRLYAATRGADGKWTMDALAVVDHADGNIGAYITALGEDSDGELYVMTNDSNMLKGNNGKLWKLVAQ